MSKPALILEFSVLFVLFPLAFRFLPVRVSPLPALWLMMAYCLYILRHDPGFAQSQLWNTAPLATAWINIAIYFAISAVAMVALVHAFAPQMLFNFVRANPAFWALVMVVYPVVSVYPQGIIYRAFIFQRYKEIFSGPLAIVLISALAFSFAHIIFRNPFAVGLTLIGGLLFAKRYLDTRSLLTSSFEHALYGCLMFTVGLGRLFLSWQQGR